MSKIKLLAMALGVVTMFGQISAYAAYPEGVINNGEYNYGPWQTTGEQPKSAITGGYPSQLYTYGNSNQFTEYWHNSNNVVETYSNIRRALWVND